MRTDPGTGASGGANALPWVLLVRMGVRNLWRYRRRNGLLVAAVATGVGTLLCAAAMIRGMVAGIEDDTIARLNGHLKATTAGYLDNPGARHAFELPGPLAAAGDPEATVRIRVPAVLQSERETRGVQLAGVDPADERRLSFLREVTVAGEWLRDAGDPRVLLGAELARQLGTAPGRRVVLMAEGADGRNVERGMQVAGTFTASNRGLETAFAFTGRDALGAALGLRGVTEYALTLDDPAALAVEQARLAAALGSRAVVSDWRALEPQAAMMVEMTGAAIGILYAVFLLGLAFGVVNTLVAAVLERVRELGLLQALGMRGRLIVLQVLIESGLIITLGIALGVALAAGVHVWLADGIDLSRWAAGTATAGLSSRIDLVPQPGDAVLVIGLVLVLGLLAALEPARRAVRLDPLVALGRQG